MEPVPGTLHDFLFFLMGYSCAACAKMYFFILILLSDYFQFGKPYLLNFGKFSLILIPLLLILSLSLKIGDSIKYMLEPSNLFSRPLKLHMNFFLYMLHSVYKIPSKYF